MSILRLRPYIDPRRPVQSSIWTRLKRLFRPTPKQLSVELPRAELIRIKNPTHWKLERNRRELRKRI